MQKAVQEQGSFIAAMAKRVCQGRISLALLLMLAINPLSAAASAIGKADNWDVYGANGVLQVHGSLTESTCRLATRSAWQDISLGNLSSSALLHPGDRGRPVNVILQLEDCMVASSTLRDDRTGSVLWSKGQPGLSISFQAPPDLDNPALVRVSGARGVALRITDLTGQEIRLGSHGRPILVTPGQNELIYTITPERTRAALSPGGWWSLLNVGLSYE